MSLTWKAKAPSGWSLQQGEEEASGRTGTEVHAQCRSSENIVTALEVKYITYWLLATILYKSGTACPNGSQMAEIKIGCHACSCSLQVPEVSLGQ